MENETSRRLEVLALLGDPRPMQALLDSLREHRYAVDVATGLADAQRLFFGTGGHDCLLLAPDIAPGLANKVLHSLRAIDPALATATFGPEVRHAGGESRTAVLAGFHPGSRAGTGAMLRFLGKLSHNGG
ncbi:MAG: hypothetical protein KDC98_07425 [Planctomycetes bacterium]|nr:hypothetical protein [Planctomycetota bacterium]